MAQPRAQAPSLDAYRKYATTREGNVARGNRLSADEQKLACAKCEGRLLKNQGALISSKKR
jgi:hypothetical protein